MSLNQDYEDELLESIEGLEDMVNEALDNDAKITQSMLTNRSVYNNIKKELNILTELDDELYYGGIVSPDEFRSLLSDITNRSERYKYVELYRRAYEDRWYGGRQYIQYMIYTVAHAIANNLSVVLPEQLKLVLKDAIRNYLRQNPGSTQYVLEKLNELKNAELHNEFVIILKELGVPKDVADLLADAIWEVSSFYIVIKGLVENSPTDQFDKSIKDVISEVEQSVKEGNI